MLRVAIIGCGKIADQHILALRRIPSCAVVAVCDRERLMAEQLAERFRIESVFEDNGAMLEAAQPDVVHVTTPPQSHAALAVQCLDSGSHVYLEKPFTVTAAEAEKVLDFAAGKGRLVTAGHNYQFAPEMIRMRQMVDEGFLGGRPVHLESHWSYDLGDLNYVGPLLGNRGHWVRKLPGQLLHNLISHGIARLAEFLDDDVEVIANAHQSQELRKLGGAKVVDELRVLLRDGRGTTGFFCFSTQLKPGVSQFRIYGPRHSLLVDQGSGSLIRLRSGSYKSYLTYFVPPVLQAWEHLSNSGRNILHFLTGKLYQDFGMKALMESFYAAIRNSGAPPIPYREILLTARIMDDVFAQTPGNESVPGPTTAVIA
jgi:predicted dehydrogenase